ncbi:MAG: hypothetical protein KAK00_05820 [Nanoarchaeota archaeon]|nr:hypothetical protein [Nanoarchaeota archaeon]
MYGVTNYFLATSPKEEKKLEQMIRLLDNNYSIKGEGAMITLYKEYERLVIITPANASSKIISIEDRLGIECDRKITEIYLEYGYTNITAENIRYRIYHSDNVEKIFQELKAPEKT